MIEIIVQVVVITMALFFFLCIAFTCGYYKGHIDGYEEGVRFGYLIAKDGAELLISNDDKL